MKLSRYFFIILLILFCSTLRSDIEVHRIINANSCVVDSALIISDGTSRDKLKCGGPATHDGDFSINAGNLSVDGSLQAKRTFSATSGVIPFDSFVHGITDTSVPRTVTIPSTKAIAGHFFIVKDESGGAGVNNITIDTQDGKTIDGLASIPITANHGAGRFYSDGSNFFTW